MALQGTTIDVPLLTDSQQRPDTSTLVGQLRYAINTVVDKYTRDGEPRTRLIKRGGMVQLGIKNFDPVTGLAHPGADDNGFRQPLGTFSELNGQRCITSGGLPYVYADGAERWELFNQEPVITTALSKKDVWFDNKQMGCFDSASVFNVFCYTWVDTVSKDAYFYVVEANGTPIRLPVKSGGAGTLPNGASTKVVSDNNYFYLIYDNAGTIEYMVVDTSGIVKSQGTIEAGGSGYFDITYQANKVMVAVSGTSPINIHTVSWDGAAWHDHTSPEVIDADRGIAFLDNPLFADDPFVYIVSVATAGPGPVENQYQLDCSGTDPVITDSITPLFTTDGRGGHVGVPAMIAGSMTTFGLTVFISFLFVEQDDPLTVVMQAGLRVQNVEHAIVASRTYVLNGRSQVVMYYPSGTGTSYIDPVTGARTAGFVQPTYFLYDVQLQAETGRFEYANAAFAWLWDGTGYDGMSPPSGGRFFYHAPSWFIDDDQVVHTSLGFLASTVTESSVERTSAISLANASDIVNIVTLPSAFTAINSFIVTGTTGLGDYRFTQDGRGVSFGDELFLPGPGATLFTGATFSEDGIGLAPEQPFSIVKSHDGSVVGMANGKHSYVLVWEWVAPTGERHRSSPCASFTVDMTGSDNIVTLTLLTLGQTRHPNVQLGVYRTWIENGTPTTQFRKVSDDLNPVVNAPQTAHISFVDKQDEVGCSVGEILYCGPGGQGMLPRDPMPGFRSGCVYQDRVFVIGWDGRIWYSAEKVPGDPLWFNQDVQVISIPTGDDPRRLIAMDGRIIIICTGSIWELNGSGFADPTGTNVNVTAPQRLPVNNGGTDNAALTKDGVVYESTTIGVNGGLFLLTRGLTVQQYSNDIQDELKAQTILGIDTDSEQNLLVTTAGQGDIGSKVFVYSQLSNTWNTWQLLGGVALTCIVDGRYNNVEYNEAMQYDPTFSIDSFPHSDPPTTSPILTKIQVDWIALGGIKNFHRCWDYMFTGTYFGPHKLKVTVVSDENGRETPTQYFFTPNPAVPYQYKLIPSQEEASRVSFLFEDDYTDVESPGSTFGLELLSFYVATGKALTRLPVAQQIGGDKTKVTVNFVGDPLNLGLVLRLNGAQEIAIPADSATYTFPVGITPGLSYKVGIKSYAVGQTIDPTDGFTGAVGLEPIILTFTVTNVP